MAAFSGGASMRTLLTFNVCVVNIEAVRWPRMATARGRRRTYHHRNLRAALVEAALGLVTREGVEALTLRGVARLAGVSPAAPYRHFADKRALLAAVAEEGFRLLATALRAAGEVGADALGRFRARGPAYVTFATSHPSHFRVMFGRELADRRGYPGLQNAAQAAFDALVEGMTDAQGAGVVGEGDPRELGLTAWSAMHGLAALLLDGRLQAMYGRSVEDLVAVVGRNVYRGLANR
jgi:AcrR family transcriptional regulator